MSHPLYQVDAFSDRPFAGNPAAVVLLTDWLDDRRMQDVAAEMNLSETAFVVPNGRGQGFRGYDFRGHDFRGHDIRGRGYDIHYFTPTIEVPACGHATLSSAHILWEIGAVAADQPVTFRTIADVEVICTRGEDGLIRMSYPADPPAPVGIGDAPDGLIAALGVEPIAVSKSSMDWIIELADRDAVLRVSPDFDGLMAIERGVAVTARGSSASEGDPRQVDFVSRFFAPAAGIDEDPVTGSVHTALGPYWAARLGKDSLHAYQASARGGELRVTMQGDRVEIAGRAVTVVRGELVGA